MSTIVSQPDPDDARQHLINVLALVSAGEKSALAELYSLTSAKLFGICIRICGDEGAAEDVLQEVYIKIWHRAAQYQAQKASPVTWLSTIARNASIDWRRKNGKEFSGNLGVIDVIADDAPLGDVLIEQREEEAHIMYCLEQLEKDQQTPIKSAFFDGFTYAELAKKAELPLSTLKSRIRRGLQKLKKCLENV